jgi:hypothetical protein
MATLPINDQGGSISLVSPHRDGDEFANTGREIVYVVNTRSDPPDDPEDVNVKVTGQGLCSMDETHDYEVLLVAGSFASVGVFERYQYNDENARLQIQLLNPDGSKLEDGDGQGHPDNLGIAVVRVIQG